MANQLFLMWTLPHTAAQTQTVNGTPVVSGSFFWATTSAGARSDLMVETTAVNLNQAPEKRPSWRRD